MKFAAVITFAAAALVVSAETNAQRMARGLPPASPMKRGSHTEDHWKPHPSGKGKGGNSCGSGSLYCCNQVQEYGQGGKCDDLVHEHGLSVAAGTLLGADCSPITVIGLGKSTCTSQTVCCDNTHFNGLINVGCNNINL